MDLKELEELYISENGIEEIESLDQNSKLKTLDLAMNKITDIRNVEHLNDLEELWVILFAIMVKKKLFKK